MESREETILGLEAQSISLEKAIFRKPVTKSFHFAAGGRSVSGYFFKQSYENGYKVFL